MFVLDLNNNEITDLAKARYQVHGIYERYSRAISCLEVKFLVVTSFCKIIKTHFLYYNKCDDLPE